jgi:hypothetical protein
MKKIILFAILLVCLKSNAQDTTNHPVIDTSYYFKTMSVAMIDSVYYNMSDTAPARWLGCQTTNDNLSNQANVNWFLLDVNKNLIASKHFILSGSDYQSWDATASWLIWYTRNRFLKSVHFTQNYTMVAVPPVPVLDTTLHN